MSVPKYCTFFDLFSSCFLNEFWELGSLKPNEVSKTIYKQNSTKYRNFLNILRQNRLFRVVAYFGPSNILNFDLLDPELPWKSIITKYRKFCDCLI